VWPRLALLLHVPGPIQIEAARLNFTVMRTATDFRNFAKACAQMARATEVEANKSVLLSMADKWTDLAENADRIRRLVRDADAVLEGPGADDEKQRIRRRFG